MNQELVWGVLAAAAAEAVVTLMLIYLWRTRERHPGLGLTAAGLGLLVAGSVYYVLYRINQPVWYGPFLYHAVMSVGTTLILNGFLIMVGRPPLWRALTGTYAAGAVVMILLMPSVGQPTFPLAQAASALSMGIAFLISAHGIYQARGDIGRHTPQALGAVVGADGVTHVLRSGVIAVQAWLPSAPSFGEIQAVNSFIQLTVILVTLVLMVQIVGDRLFAQLHASREALASAFHVASDGFALFDRQGCLLNANRRVAALFPELDGLLAPGRAFTALFGAAPERYGFTPDFVTRFAVARHQCAFDAQSEPRPDFWVRVTVSPAASGGALVCWADVSDFKRVERLLQQELGRERDLARLRSGFVSMASHEFRTPLAIIDVAAQRLNPRNWPPQREQAAESVRRIRDAVARVLRLIDTMLTPAATRQEGMKLVATPTDLRALIADLCARHQAAMAPPKVIEQDLDGLPPIVVCDAELIGHALVHLVGNADKYSPGAAAIRVRGTTAGGEVAIAVTDSGIGIPPADHGLVFERFFRSANALAFEGTGMGLAIVREIAGLHGGAVDIDSAVGRGTTVTLRFPVDDGN